MSKNQELQRLDQFIASLPKDSYLRPWLEDVRPQVESEIRSDFPVSPSLFATRVDCDALKAGTKSNCEAQLAAARREAEKIEKAACDRAANIRARVCDDLRASLRQMES